MSTAITERRLLILRTPGEVQRWSDRVRSSGMSVGMVPTMGALHAGHASLMARARAQCDRVLVSIFVNPTQFVAGDDLERYPRTWDADVALCAEAGVDSIFAPPTEAMYPAGFATTVRVGGPATEGLEATHRPGHFDGVATVVTKLLTVGRPDRAYFGRKDSQQCAVVRRLVRDLDLGCTVVVCPTVRESDGLAVSSRNRFLSASQRSQALAIPAALAAASRAWAAGLRQPGRLADMVRGELARSPGLEVAYVAVVDPETFRAADSRPDDATVSHDSGVRCEILIAARLGGTRLIDGFEPGLDDPPVVDREGSPSV